MASSIANQSIMAKVLKHPFLIAFAVNALLFCFVFLRFGIVFETYDDYNVMLTVAGEKTGEPYWQTTFYNSILAFLVSRLYTVTNQIQWYSVIEFGFLFVSSSVMLAILLDKSRGTILPPLAVIAIYSLFFGTVFMYAVQRMQFTTTGAMLGAASVAVFFSVDKDFLDQGERVGRRLFLGVLLLVLSIAERKSSGLCCSVFVVAALVKLVLLDGVGISFLKKRQALLRTTLVTAITGIVAIAIVIVGHSVVMNTGDNAGYSDYDKWRVAYQDHPHPTYNDAKEVYESVGWTESSYYLAQSLVYIDAGINKLAFEEIAESQEYQSVQRTLPGAVVLFAKLFKESTVAKSSVFAIAVLAIFVLCVSLFSIRIMKSKRPRDTILCVIVLAIGSLAMALFICLSGRWLLRTFQTIAFPLLSSYLLLAMGVFRELGSEGAGRGAHAHAEPLAFDVENGSSIWSTAKAHSPFVISVAIIVIAVWGMCFHLSEAAIYSLARNDHISLERIESVEMWASEHPDNVYIHDYSICNIGDSYDPFKSYSDKGITNLIVSGGSYTYTGCYYGQLAANNLNAISGETLLDEGVFYVSTPGKSGSSESRVLAYLESKYGDVEMNVTATLAHGACVYKFSLATERDVEPSIDGPGTDGETSDTQ